MGRREGCEPPESLHPLPLLGDGTAAPSLVGGDNDVDEPLEEVALLRGARAPRVLECLVRFEEGARPGERESPLV